MSTNTDICFRSRMPRCRVDPGKIILSPILYRTYDWKGGRPPLPIVNRLQTQNFNHKWQSCSIFDHAAYWDAKMFLWMNEVMLLGVFLKMAIPSTVGILWHPSGIYSEFPNAMGSHPVSDQFSEAGYIPNAHLRQATCIQHSHSSAARSCRQHKFMQFNNNYNSTQALW